MFGQGAGHISEGQAGLHGGILPAGDAQVVILVAAETGAYADEISLLDDVGRPLVVQDMVGLLCHEDGFVDKDPPQFSIHSQEEFFDEILFHIDILIKKFAQIFLVYIAPGSHQGELKKADHGRGEDKLSHAAVIGVDQQSFLTEVVQKLLCLCFRRAPELRRLLQGKRTDGKLCHPLCLFLCKEHLQDLCQRLRSGRPLGEPVDPVFQFFICVSRCQMSHNSISITFERSLAQDYLNIFEAAETDERQGTVLCLLFFIRGDKEPSPVSPVSSEGW